MNKAVVQTQAAQLCPSSPGKYITVTCARMQLSARQSTATIPNLLPQRVRQPHFRPPAIPTQNGNPGMPADSHRFWRVPCIASHNFYLHRPAAQLHRCRNLRLRYPVSVKVSRVEGRLPLSAIRHDICSYFIRASLQQQAPCGHRTAAVLPQRRWQVKNPPPPRHRRSHSLGRGYSGDSVRPGGLECCSHQQASAPPPVHPTSIEQSCCLTKRRPGPKLHLPFLRKVRGNLQHVHSPPGQHSG